MTPNALNDCNSKLVLDDGVYREINQSTVDTKLSSYLSIAVPQLLSVDVNKSLFSYELERYLTTPELRHEFSYAPYNMLRACDFTQLPSADCALDLTQDFGGTAHFLCQAFEQVDSIQLDLGAAKLARRRFPDISNLNILVKDIAEVSFPENHYDCIFIGKLEDLGLDKSQTRRLLRLLNTALKSDGVLIISLKNPDRLSKWLNTESHEADPLTPYADLYSPEQDVLFNLHEIQETMQDCGLAQANINASFSSIATVPNLLSLDYLENSPSALNHFYRLGSIKSSNVNEYLMYKTLRQQGKNISEFASRYVIFVGKTDRAGKLLYNRDFTHFPGLSRRAEWRNITFKNCGEAIVHKQATASFLDKGLDEASKTNTESLISQNLEPQPFQEGSLLLDAWLNAIVDKDNSAFTELVKAYYNWLSELSNSSGTASEQLNLGDGDKVFSQFAYDLLPFNIVCDESEPTNTYRIIDPEWRLNTEITADFILFRALLWFAFENRVLLIAFCDHWGFQNIDSFVRHYINAVSSDQNLDEFIELEERIQLEISNTFNANSVGMALRQNFSRKVEQTGRAPVACVTWADSADHFEQAHSVYIDWLASPNIQSLSAEFQNQDHNKAILRVDPIDHSGLFRFTSIRLLDKGGHVIWECTNAENIVSIAELRNIETSIDLDSQDTTYIALNDDPFFLFDLSEHPKLDSVQRIELSLGLYNEPNYAAALKNLALLVDKQANSIVRLGNKAHETRADIDALEARLQHKENERKHLAERLEGMDSLILQNQQLHNELMRTPSARLKRLLKKLLGNTSA